jgi:hypothetical protein
MHQSPAGAIRDVQVNHHKRASARTFRFNRNGKGSRASDPKVGTGFGINPMLKQNARATTPDSTRASVALVARLAVSPASSLAFETELFLVIALVAQLPTRFLVRGGPQTILTILTARPRAVQVQEVFVFASKAHGLAFRGLSKCGSREHDGSRDGRGEQE